MKNMRTIEKRIEKLNFEKHHYDVLITGSLYAIVDNDEIDIDTFIDMCSDVVNYNKFKQQCQTKIDMYTNVLKREA